VRTNTQRRAGWTLIELILTILLVAIALAAVVPFLGGTFTRSNEPRTQIVDAMELQSGIEDIVALQTPSTTLPQLRTRVGPEGGTWNVHLTIVENRFVGFPGGAETAAPATNSLLKITLRNALGERITRLFSDPL